MADDACLITLLHRCYGFVSNHQARWHNNIYTKKQERCNTCVKDDKEVLFSREGVEAVSGNPEHFRFFDCDNEYICT